MKADQNGFIYDLEKGEVIVVGTNESGIHGKGAAKTAYEKFGLKWTTYSGMSGRTYGIPTRDTRIRTLPFESIKKYVDVFLDYANRNQHLKFYVTEIGCGLAGYRPEQIAPMFKNLPVNALLPEAFKQLTLEKSV